MTTTAQSDEHLRRIRAIMTRLWFRFMRSEDKRYQPTESDLLSFEKQLGRTLPLDYRAFLQNFGITAFDNCVSFQVTNGPSRGTDSLWVFHGYSPGDNWDIQLKWQSDCFIRPKSFLPIACSDASGADILLSLREADFGHIYYIDRETRWDFEEALDQDRDAEIMEFLGWVSPSFIAFLESLRGEDPVNQAVHWGSVEQLARLLDEAQPADLPDYIGWFPCENAVGNGITKLRLLLQHGAPIKMALLNAARSADLDAMNLLLEHGADVNAWEEDRWNGCTALHEAINYGAVKSVRFLLAHGADPSIRGGCGKTALELARALNKDEIVALLQGKNA